MFSTILTIRKRDDISRDDFIDYYENKHAPLVGRLLPNTLLSYRRNYLLDDDPLSVELAQGRGDDTTLPNIAVITEARFASRSDAEELVSAILSQEIFKQIQADEDNFIARGGVRWRVVDARE
jgi:hypothetical protein